MGVLYYTVYEMIGLLLIFRTVLNASGNGWQALFYCSCQYTATPCRVWMSYLAVLLLPPPPTPPPV
jgi:hypothetical protein